MFHLCRMARAMPWMGCAAVYMLESTYFMARCQLRRALRILRQLRHAPPVQLLTDAGFKHGHWIHCDHTMRREGGKKGSARHFFWPPRALPHAAMCDYPPPCCTIVYLPWRA